MDARAEAVMTPRPAKAERDELRRSQIAEAAKRCVCRRGFHAASMAEIAAEAKMSAGQIYRYFASKEAIVADIVARIVQHRLGWIAESVGHPDLAAHLAASLLRRPSADELADEALLLEVTAEAARNPVIAAIVKRADQDFRDVAAAKARRDYPQLTKAQLEARVEMMSLISEGMASRRVLENSADTPTRRALMKSVIEVLFPPR